MSEKKGRGHLITLEGVEGAGKSTQIPKIQSFLADSGIQSVSTREPGGKHHLKSLRNILLSPENGSMQPLAESFLLMADRAQHVNRVVLPALKEGLWVISDRYADATLAYQGYGKGLDLSLLRYLNLHATANTVPGLTFLFDLDPRTGLERADKRRNLTGKPGDQENKNSLYTSRKDRFEMETIDFHHRVRNGYLKLAEEEPERFRIIDANCQPGTILERIKTSLLSRFPELRKR